jgi:hypothetical protein
MAQPTPFEGIQDVEADDCECDLAQRQIVREPTARMKENEILWRATEYFAQPLRIEPPAGSRPPE